MILSIMERGLRFVVADPYGHEFCDQTQEFIDGEGTAFYSRNDAALKVRELLLAGRGDKQVRRYTAPVIVEIFSDEEVDHETLSDWCLQSTRLIMYPENGLGPGGQENLGLVSIHWGLLKQLESQDN